MHVNVKSHIRLQFVAQMCPTVVYFKHKYLYAE